MNVMGLLGQLLGLLIRGIPLYNTNAFEMAAMNPPPMFRVDIHHAVKAFFTHVDFSR